MYKRSCTESPEEEADLQAEAHADLRLYADEPGSDCESTRLGSTIVHRHQVQCPRLQSSLVDSRRIGLLGDNTGYNISMKFVVCFVCYATNGLLATKSGIRCHAPDYVFKVF